MFVTYVYKSTDFKIALWAGIMQIRGHSQVLYIWPHHSYCLMLITLFSFGVCIDILSKGGVMDSSSIPHAWVQREQTSKEKRKRKSLLSLSAEKVKKENRAIEKLKPKNKGRLGYRENVPGKEKDWSSQRRKIISKASPDPLHIESLNEFHNAVVSDV